VSWSGPEWPTNALFLIQALKEQSGLVENARIRQAEISDLVTLTRIINHYVATSHITFETEPFTVAGRMEWLERFAPTGPHRLLVAQMRERVVGFASSSTFRSKPAYRTSVETTVYLDPEFHGQGLGTALYAALFDVLQKEPQVHRAYGVIAQPNPASVALHRRLGFNLIGTLSEAGLKFGRYWDVSLYEKSVN
jgi:phosphinothricin acetyltransferase